MTRAGLGNVDHALFREPDILHDPIALFLKRLLLIEMCCREGTGVML